jgi:hypothetical protein
MGQQQLLLLVLATVIVGLSAVAGIQAFDENQQQANQDAMVQRATSIISDLKGELSRPDQLGGVSYGDTESNVLDQMGYEDGASNTEVPVEGASADVDCELGLTGSAAVVRCGNNGPSSLTTVYVTLNEGGNGEVQTGFGSIPGSISFPSNS